MPKLVDHDARRDAIAAAAARAIAEQGIDRVTTHDLAKAAGCTVGALPRYFRNKDEILVAALRHVVAGVRKRATAVVLNHGVLEPMRMWAQVLPVGAPQRREWQVWIAFSGRAATHPELRDEFKQRYEEGHKDTRLLLKTMRDNRELPYDLDLDDAAELLTSVVDGLGIRATLQPRDWPAAKQLSHVARALRLLGWTGPA